ncbi:MAG: hypothetical protein SGI71_05645 [Verrucomicrobiota bacterium]|nr:hypothetical protein [Verrucomicrobiota bacterium]
MIAKLKLPVVAIIYFVTFLFITPARAANEDLDFVLINATGGNIVSVYIAPHDSDEWGDDVMTNDIIRDGENANIEFHPKTTVKLWDLRIEDKEGNSVEWESLDLSQIEKLTLKIVNKKPMATWE